MPALITHYLQVLDTAERLNDSRLSPEAVALGAQGPDVFYFHRLVPILQMGKTYRKIGTKLHHCDPDKILSSMAAYLTAHPGDHIAYSYALGFICHYSLDRTAHPYVYAMQEDMIKTQNFKCFDGLIHSKIEHSLDVIMLREKTGKNGAEFSPLTCLSKDKAVISGSARLLKFVIDKLLPEEKVTEKKIAEAFYDLRTCQRLLYDPHLYKSAIFSALEKLVRKGPFITAFIRPMMEDGLWDYSNFEKGEWKSPFLPEVSTDKSFFEIFDESVEDSVNLIWKFKEQLEKKASFFEITDKRSFKTGLPQDRKFEELY